MAFTPWSKMSSELQPSFLHSSQQEPDWKTLSRCWTWPSISFPLARCLNWKRQSLFHTVMTPGKVVGRSSSKEVTVSGQQHLCPCIQAKVLGRSCSKTHLNKGDIHAAFSIISSSRFQSGCHALDMDQRCPWGCMTMDAGSSPSGSREFEAGTVLARKDLFIY